MWKGGRERKPTSTDDNEDGEEGGMGVQPRAGGLAICTVRAGKLKKMGYDDSTPVVAHCHAALRSVG